MTLDQEIQETWNKLRETSKGFMNSFQTRSVKLGGEGADLYIGKYGFQDTAYGRNGLVISEMNTYFGSKLSDSNRGENAAYMLLKRDGGKGELLSYGACHTDAGGRTNNMHYFVIQGDYALLQKTLEGFRQEPKSIAQFVDVVFEWSNPTQKSVFGHGFTAYPNVVADMKELYTLEVAAEYSFMKKMKIKWKGNAAVRRVVV